MTEFSVLTKRYGLFVLLLLAFGMEFWKLGTHPANSFDEARFGVHAFEMDQNGDYFNLYYQGKPDAWVARPPLKSWLTLLGYKLLGFNEWGLRLSSGLFILVFFYYAYRWLELYLGSIRACVGGLILLSIKGIVGFHVGRNGDMDAEFIALSMGFLNYFSRYLHFDKKNAILYAAVFLALAFWFKTMACLFYLPGIFLYAVTSKKARSLIKDRFLWYGSLLFSLGVLSWFIIVAFWGTRYVNTPYAGDNALETMVLYDIWMRFTGTQFDGHPVLPSYHFFFTNLDVRYNVWNYFFYGGMALFLFQKWKGLVMTKYDKLLGLCAWIILPVFVLLTFGMHKLDWYSAPLLPILTVFVLYLMDNLLLRMPWFKWAVGGLLCFTLVRQEVYLEEQSHVENEASFFLAHKAKWQGADTLWVIGDAPQNIYLNMLWTKKPVGIASDAKVFSQKKDRIGFAFSEVVDKKPKLHQIAEYHDDRLGIHFALVESTN
jgi:4-amino-4-deoxy-L-arabinose transferase-like glycosyltransferase